ncbi:PREDICTED: polyhomeotic-like protein 2 [Ficedula albicollis]|nr:PREDICTED: polyhomeotic-like protein 2 [Ficedula albicollis]
MENEQLPAPVPASSGGGTAPTPTSTTAMRPPGPQISVYSGIPDRQTVQVIQQALHRQPNTAAQYLQQMYAAQQQHLMLQTAALQQQHLTSAQLQSLAAVQQASLAANRQSSSSGGNGTQPAPAQQPTINLATSPAAAQLLNRAQSVGPGASGIAQQAVLLGNTASPALTASQAQMYLRAQMLIFTPTGPVSAVRAPEGTDTVSSSLLEGDPGAYAPLQSPQFLQQPLKPMQPQPPPQQQQQHPGPAPQPKTGVPQGAGGEGGPLNGHPGCHAAPRKFQHASAVILQLQPAGPMVHAHARTHVSETGVCLVHAQGPADGVRHSQAPQSNRGMLRSGLRGAGLCCGKVPRPTRAHGVTHALFGPHGGARAQLGRCGLTGASQRRWGASGPLRVLWGPFNPFGSPSGAARGSPGGTGSGGSCSPSQLYGNVGPRQRGVSARPSPRVPLSPEPPERLHAQPRLPGMTSGSGSAAATVAGAAPHNGENKPPQAIVKPQILTHVIEGFVIQEGAEPFPVGRSSLLVGALHKQYAQELLPDKLPPQDNTTTTDSDMEEPYLQESKEEGNPPKLKCELCGRVDFAYKFKRSKRFCSMACAKRYNVGCTKRVGLFHPDRSKLQKPGGPPHGRRRSCKGTLPPLSKDSKKQPAGSVPAGSVTASLQLNHSQEDSSRCSDNSSYEEPLSPISASSSTSRRRQGERDLELRDMELPDVHGRDLPGLGHRFLPSEPSKWNVEDVYEFIRSLPGCQEIAEEFRAQEIDGQALLLLKEDHLMSTMNIKLGPALKIYARINMLKDS